MEGLGELVNEEVAIPTWQEGRPRENFFDRGLQPRWAPCEEVPQQPSEDGERVVSVRLAVGFAEAERRSVATSKHDVVTSQVAMTRFG